jgi:hydroxymethylpyrimidine/phosphomethylpyrimidine kinase
MQHKVLSIAGFDSSGGAGIQADIKTASAFGCYAMTVLTALPIQNTTGVKRCYELPVIAVVEQLEAVFDDVVPAAIKIGMLFNTAVIEAVAVFLKKYSCIPIVLDPVMVAKSGDSLLLPQAVQRLQSALIPLSTLITPNLHEAAILTGQLAKCRREMELVAYKLICLGAKAVLLKGGHLEGEDACDLYLSRDDQKIWLEAPKIRTCNTHGTGCTLSAAIASGLALGLDLVESCRIAKRYLSQAIAAAQCLQIGMGAGPVHHFYHLWPTLSKI